MNQCHHTTMKKRPFCYVHIISFLLLANACFAAESGLPATGSFKVAYYVYDSGGPDHYPLTSFTDGANTVVLFEGKLWELVDSVHYATGAMRNVNYHSYSEIMRDVRILQSRGVKVLINLDDAASWSTSTPFMTYDSIAFTYQQFAAFVKACAIDSLHLDGISLDIEHGATWNANYIALLKEFGKYFGPRSSDSTSQMYIAAIFSSSFGIPGSSLGKSKDVTSYMNFVMDMAYFNLNYATRFNQWADSIGASKTMIGVLNDYYDVTRAQSAAAWQPSHPPKAGIMVYAANNLKSYTDAAFGSLVSVAEDATSPRSFALLQNFPNPFNPSTTICYELSTSGHVLLKVYDALGREVETLVNADQAAGSHSVRFDATRCSSGVYFYHLSESGQTNVKKMMLVR